MQISVNMTLDLTTPAGREMFARIGQLGETPAGLAAGPVLPLPDPVVVPPPSLPKAVATKATKTTKPGPVEKVLGPPDLNGAGPEDQADDDLGLGPETPSMSPGEARDAGLALVRQLYTAHKAEVKALQKEWQIAKFYDIPVERGHEFYARVVQIAQGVGLQV